MKTIALSLVDQIVWQRPEFHKLCRPKALVTHEAIPCQCTYRNESPLYVYDKELGHEGEGER